MTNASTALAALAAEGCASDETYAILEKHIKEIRIEFGKIKRRNMANRQAAASGPIPSVPNTSATEGARSGLSTTNPTQNSLNATGLKNLASIVYITLLHHPQACLLLIACITFSKPVSTVAGPSSSGATQGARSGLGATNPTQSLPRAAGFVKKIILYTTPPMILNYLYYILKTCRHSCGSKFIRCREPPKSKAKGRKKEKCRKKGMNAQPKRKNRCSVCKSTDHNAQRCSDKLRREVGGQ